MFIPVPGVAYGPVRCVVVLVHGGSVLSFTCVLSVFQAPVGVPQAAAVEQPAGPSALLPLSVERLEGTE